MDPIRIFAIITLAVVVVTAVVILRSPPPAWRVCSALSVIGIICCAFFPFQPDVSWPFVLQALFWFAFALGFTALSFRLQRSRSQDGDMPATLFSTWRMRILLLIFALYVTRLLLNPFLERSVIGTR
jgi:hypothetical protein